MGIIRVKSGYYQQFDADYSLDVPGEGYGGWKKAELPLNMDKTALVIMHSVYYGEKEDIPGVFRACEYIPRAYKTGQTVMPRLISAARKAGLRIIHVGMDAAFCKSYPGYQKVLEISGQSEVFRQVDSDPVLDELRQFKTDSAFPGKHNLPSYAKMSEILRFDANTEPVGEELVVTDDKQLLAVCREYGVNHLIYSGYNINWCIMFSGGGFMHIFRHGVMCSAVREAVTAVENRESARHETGKEMALWTLAVGFGYIYDMDDLVPALNEYSERSLK